MPSLPDIVFGTQGLLLLANGVYTLLYPLKAAEPSSPMAGTPVPVVHAMRCVYRPTPRSSFFCFSNTETCSMTSFSLGFFFLQVAYQGNRDFMVTAVPMRFLAAGVFAYHGGKWGNVALYEATWGLVSIGALMW